ncbi:hypothetical protein BD779DRAFT_1544334 [Infundibulicybe gibba]|nr:hypothetical protein BD779DRAFT_1544334 [Infundibulicybe gibba]
MDQYLPPNLVGKIQDNIERARSSVRAKFARYPLSLSPSVPWPQGVGALLPIRLQHEWEMLRGLRWGWVCWVVAHPFAGFNQFIP